MPNPKITLAMMVKDEEKSIQLSLNSCKDIVSSIHIYDTGSTDNTLERVREFGKENINIKIHIKQGVFEDFSSSRNVLLDFVDETNDSDFIILLDSNDEFKGGVDIFKWIKDTDHEAFLVRQEWYYGSSSNTYYNLRLLKTHSGWRYKGVVHEYLSSPTNSKRGKIIDDNIVIYQDRTRFSENSSGRHLRDYILLKQEHERNPNEPRTLFYLAQTCSSIGKTQEAFDYYYLRTKEGGFYEEIMCSYWNMGDLSIKLGKPSEEIVKWYLKGMELETRVEPLLKLAKYYLYNSNVREKHKIAYGFTSIALRLKYPKDAILFVDENSYIYERYHLHGIIAYYVGDYEGGSEACKEAIEVKNLKVDKDNLKFYELKSKLN